MVLESPRTKWLARASYCSEDAYGTLDLTAESDGNGVLTGVVCRDANSTGRIEAILLATRRLRVT